MKKKMMAMIDKLAIEKLRFGPALSLLIGVSLISGCAAGNGNTSSTSGQSTPTPTPSAHSVAVTWTPSPSTDLQGYRVYRSQISGGPYTEVSGTLPTSPQQFTDSTVLSGQNYFYVVTSIDANGLESAPSPQASATIPTP